MEFGVVWNVTKNGLKRGTILPTEFNLSVDTDGQIPSVDTDGITDGMLRI
jgi:hypothetical protein